MIHLIIKVGIDVEESGLNQDEIKKDIVQFTKNLFILGAEEQGIGLTMEGVGIVGIPYMREQGNLNVRTVLDILDDTRTVLFEMLRL